MRPYLLLAFILLFLPISVLLANSYEDAWKALEKNDRQTAMEDLKKAFDDPKYGTDAYITYLYLSSFEGRQTNATEFVSRVYDRLEDPNPYVYAMWFEQNVLGNYGKKTSYQQALVDKILNDGRCNGSIVAAAHYVQSWTDLSSNQIARSWDQARKMGAAGPVWQLVGPFDNISGSGFDKDYGPLRHPEADAVFKSATDADIRWFTPATMNKDGWTFPYSHFQYPTAVLYAQIFIQSPSDMRVLLNAGFNGAIKIWVNDQPVIAEQKELVTELDYLKHYVQLKKGYNRLLVQLSYTNNNFPNFIVRLTDDRYFPIPGLSYTPTYQPYTPAAASGEAPVSIAHFAETYFEKKITDDPDNLINYILLAESYLRAQRTTEARTLLEGVINRYPENALLRLELMNCYLKEGNNTLLLQETERMKDKDPDCLLASMVYINQLMQSEKYTDADQEMKKFESRFPEVDVDMLSTKVELAGNLNRMDELVNLVEEAYRRHPENTNALTMMFNLRLKVKKDVKGALQVYEDYLRDNYNFQVVKALAAEYKNQGMMDKQLRLLKGLSDNFPYDPELFTNISSYYFDEQDYPKAIDWARKALALAPYTSTYWENLGVELEQQHQDSDAAAAYRKAIDYDANNYTSREQLRQLEQKPSVWKAFPDENVDSVIQHSSEDVVNDYNYFYLLDEKYAVVYPEGACEEYFTFVIKILNDKGIDYWKETNISYNDNTSSLIIDKAEVVKPNGVKTPADQNDNQLVFTGLTAGDAIVLKYKIQYYEHGRLARDYWNKFIFNAFVPEKLSRFCLLIAKDKPVHFRSLHGAPEPVTSRFDDFTLYEWKMDHSAALLSETYMPPLGDVSPSVTVSTIGAWSDIAAWYSDLSSQKSNTDFEVRRVFEQLFPHGTSGMSQKAVADSIYTYISRNIRYSSVSFRQSALTPQKPSVTINTGLGDCKDLSTLFVTLARLAGIHANLVLVHTRDNGRETMPLPSVEFNHCIVKAELDKKSYYLELTDNSLPFCSLPSDLMDAASLVIPENSKDTAGVRLDYIVAQNRTTDRYIHRTSITVENNDLHLKTEMVRTGALAAGVKNDYLSLSEKEKHDQMEKNISGRYTNAVQLTALSFKGLNDRYDSVAYQCDYTVKNEVNELGDIRMMKIPFEEQVATLDNFTVTDRHYPVEYYRYEVADEYHAVIDITAPAGAHFIELPKDQTFSFRGSRYSLRFVNKGDNHLTVIRDAWLNRDDVAPADYAGMKDFLSKIVQAESKLVAFKKS